MNTNVKNLKGTTEGLVAKLKAHGIASSDQLLAASATPAGRTELAKALGIDAKAMLELANRADLARIKGIAGVFSDLLENAGVDTVKELANRRADNLHAKLVEINTQMKLSGRVPTPKEVAGWVAQAKELPKKLEY